MKTRLLIAAMATFLFLNGCGSEEKTGDAPKKEKTPIATQIAQKGQEAVEAVTKTAEKLQKETVEKTTKMTDTVTQKTEELKKTAHDMTTSVQEKAEDIAEMAKQKTSSLKEKTEGSIAALVPGTQQSPEPVEENRPTETAHVLSATDAASNTEPTTMVAETTSINKIQKASVTSAAPDTVVIDNKKGTIIMPHKVHAAKYNCTTCHGEATPGPLNLDKNTAHSLCKGCHKETSSGPTKCYGCHAKKPVKPIEGC